MPASRQAPDHDHFPRIEIITFPRVNHPKKKKMELLWVLANSIARTQTAGTLEVPRFAGDLIMFGRLLSASFVIMSLATVPTLAADENSAREDIALATNSMLLFGGPSKEYPRIGIITWGQGLSVLSCESSAEWCQVEADGQRGWVQSSKLTWGEDGQRKVMRKRISPVQLTL